MNILSIQFVLFLIAVLSIYWLINEKYKKYVILFSCLLFCLSYGIKQFLYINLYVLITYFLSNYSKNKNLLMISVVVSLIPLFISKYASSLGFSIIAISFVSFRAISYIVDSYKKINTNDNFVDYLIYMTFLPVFLSGPIEKPTLFFDEINKKKILKHNELIESMFIIIYGLMLKLVIADRINPIIKHIYTNKDLFGFYTLIAVFMYSIYIYADFAGYSYIALGLSKLFGYNVTINFKQPYFAKSIKEFWNRWHISLNIWLRDYIYIPLGGNRLGKFRKQLNILTVFFISGIWHGTGLGFIIWGLLNAIYQIIGEYTSGFRNKLLSKFKYRNILSRLCVFILISFTWIFFSEGFFGATEVLKCILTSGNAGISELLLNIYDNTGISLEVVIAIAVAIMVGFAVDILNNKKDNLANRLANSKPIIRFVALYIAMIFVIYYGKYGSGMDLSSFVYFNF